MPPEGAAHDSYRNQNGAPAWILSIPSSLISLLVLQFLLVVERIGLTEIADRSSVDFHPNPGVHEVFRQFQVERGEPVKRTWEITFHGAKRSQHRLKAAALHKYGRTLGIGSKL